MVSEIPHPVIISTTQDLSALVDQIRHEPLIAVDSESNSLYAYRQRVCLIQLSTRNGDWVVDPLAIDDMSPLGPLMADPAIEKIFHAAEYDIMCMKRDFDFSFSNLFDTMVSARILGMKTLGLGNMLETFFGIHVDKRYQRADWSVRPLPTEQLRYAQHDTHYLPALRDSLITMLDEKTCLDEAREVFALLTDVPAASAFSFDPDGYWRINAARPLDRRQMAILRELYLLRDQLSQQSDRPPFKVMSDEVLVEIVKTLPESSQQLAKIHGLNRYMVDRQGKAILSAVKRGQTAPLPQRPEREPRLDPATMARYDALHEWRKTRAAERGVESDVIIPKDALWAIARNKPQSLDDLDHIPGLGPWKKEKYGAELLELIANV